MTPPHMDRLQRFFDHSVRVLVCALVALRPPLLAPGIGILSALLREDRHEAARRLADLVPLLPDQYLPGDVAVALGHLAGVGLRCFAPRAPMHVVGGVPVAFCEPRFPTWTPPPLAPEEADVLDLEVAAALESLAGPSAVRLALPAPPTTP